MATIETKLLPGFTGKAKTINVNVCADDHEMKAHPMFSNGTITLKVFNDKGFHVLSSTGYDANIANPRPDPAKVKVVSGGWVLCSHSGPGKSYQSACVSESLWNQIESKVPTLPEMTLIGQWVLYALDHYNSSGRKRSKDDLGRHLGREIGYSEGAKQAETAWMVGIDECLGHGFVLAIGGKSGSKPRGYKVSDLGKQVADQLNLNSCDIEKKVAEELMKG